MTWYPSIRIRLNEGEPNDTPDTKNNKNRQNAQGTCSKIPRACFFWRRRSAAGMLIGHTKLKTTKNRQNTQGTCSKNPGACLFWGRRSAAGMLIGHTRLKVVILEIRGSCLGSPPRIIGCYLVAIFATCIVWLLFVSFGRYFIILVAICWFRAE